MFGHLIKVDRREPRSGKTTLSQILRFPGGGHWVSTPLDHTSSLFSSLLYLPSSPCLPPPSPPPSSSKPATQFAWVSSSGEGGLECPSGRRSKPQSLVIVLSERSQHLDLQSPSSCIFSLSSEYGGRGKRHDPSSYYPSSLNNNRISNMY